MEAHKSSVKSWPNWGRFILIAKGKKLANKQNSNCRKDVVFLPPNFFLKKKKATLVVLFNLPIWYLMKLNYLASMHLMSKCTTSLLNAVNPAPLRPDHPKIESK
jgi:hypothetical protein